MPRKLVSASFKFVRLTAMPLLVSEGSAEMMTEIVTVCSANVAILRASTTSGARRQLAKMIPARKARISVRRVVRKIAITRRIMAMTRNIVPEKNGRKARARAVPAIIPTTQE